MKRHSQSRNGRSIFIAFSLLLLSFFSFATTSAQRTFKHPQYVYAYCFSSDVHLQKVEMTDTATVLTIKNDRKDKTVLLKHSCYIEDNNGNHYPIKGTRGTAGLTDTDTRTTTENTFDLLFPPLPNSTQAFDLHGGQMVWDFCVYGIHERGTKPCLDQADENLAPDSLQAELTHQGTVCVKGHVEGCDSIAPEVWMLEFSDEFDGGWLRPTRVPVLVRSDGTFEKHLNLPHPCMAKLQPGVGSGSWPYMLYLNPNDTCCITVTRRHGQTVGLTYAPGTPHANLLKHFPTWTDAIVPLDENASMENNLTALDEAEDAQLTACNYLAHQFQFSPFENKLLKNEVRMRFLIRKFVLAYRHLGKRTEVERKPTHQTLTATLEQMPYDKMGEFGFLSQDTFADDSYALCSGLNELRISAQLCPLTKAYFELYMQQVHMLPLVDLKMDSAFLHLQAALRLFTQRPQPSALDEALILYKCQALLDRFGADSCIPQYIAQLQPLVRSPYLGRRIPELVARFTGLQKREAPSYERVTDSEPNDIEYVVIDSIAGKYRGKYVQIVSITDELGKERLISDWENLIADFAESENVVFLVAEREGAMSLDIQDLLRRTYFTTCPDHLIFLSDEDYAKLSVLSGDVTGRFDHLTVNREGRVLADPLPVEETAFRRTLRRMLQEEKTAAAIPHKNE